MSIPIGIDKSAPFSSMADRITHNQREGTAFGGSAVIIPPEGGGDPVEILLLDSKQDAATFFMVLQAKITKALEDLKDAERRSHYGGR